MKSFYSIKRVYYADDDPDDRFLFQEVLAEIDASVHLTLADSGHALIDTLRAMSTLPDVIFLDWNMPVKNGFQCLQEIKQHQRLKNIPVVIISTSSAISLGRTTLDEGAFRYIQKPVYFAQLKTLIHECLQEVVELHREVT
jgi:CheY-like chemotaxis protein